MSVTIAICTWNRSGLLDHTLREMHRLRVPPGVEWELLVVNNNCTDDTDEVIARHQPHLPLRRLHEPKQGHSHARNCAVAAARGDLLIWTDDDVLVDPDWLAQHVKASRDWPEASFFGGTVDPWFEAEPPAWMRRHLNELNGLFVITQHGNETRPLRPGEWLVGANMAFRTSVLKQHPFDTTLGRVRADIIGADDTEMLGRLQRLAHTGVWVGPAKVTHFIPAGRLTTAFAARWFRGAGRTQVRQHGLGDGRLVLGLPRWALRQYVVELSLSWLLAPLKGPRWFRAFRQANILRGILHEYRARSHSAEDGAGISVEPPAGQAPTSALPIR